MPSLTIDDVQNWAVLRGIGHIVMSWNGNWMQTPHGVIIGSRSQKRPARICQRRPAPLPHLMEEPCRA